MAADQGRERHGIALLPEGRLAHQYFADGRHAGWRRDEVSEKAVRFLFAPVWLEGDVRLKDVFAVFRRNPLLNEVYFLHWAAELVEEAFAGPAPAYDGRYDPEGIEYLEVYQQWHVDSGAKTDWLMPLWCFRGMGFVLREDYGYSAGRVFPKGDRVGWSLSFRSPRELSEWPLKVNDQVEIREAGDGRQHGEAIDTVTCTSMTLGQLLQAIVWELSFHGPGPEREAQRETLMRSLETITERLKAGASASGQE